MDLKECPFCQEIGFDAIGLKNHLLSGHCKIFDETISIEQERHLTTKPKKFTEPRYDEVYFKGQKELLDNN